MTLIEKINQLLAEGKLGTAIEMATDAIKDVDNSIYNTLILLKGQNASNEREYGQNMLSGDEYRRTKARINHGFQGAVGDFPERVLNNQIDEVDNLENHRTVTRNTDKNNVTTTNNTINNQGFENLNFKGINGGNINVNVGGGNAQNNQNPIENNKISIVVATANPADTGRVQIDEIIRSMQQQLVTSRHRDRFEFVPLVATRVNDLRQAFIDKSPNILIFVGHGSETGSLAFVSEGGTRHMATPEAIAGLLSIFDEDLKCVVLSACYADEQANAIHQNIDFVVGTDDSVHEKNAKAFTEAFIQAIAGGMSFNKACKLSSNAILFSNHQGSTKWFSLVREEAKNQAKKPFIELI